MNDYKVTIIMSNYNQEKYIGQAIKSVLAQKTNFAWQLIITDDHSTQDNSVQMIKQYAQQHPDKIKILLNQENGGYLKNILRAKAITKTPYFCLLDADDYWTDPHFLQNAVDFLDSHPDFTIYSRNVLCLYEDGKSRLFINKQTPTADYTIENYFENTLTITQTTGTFFRNIIFQKGIPTIMTQAIGTISERSFEGDCDRYIMHLKYGKAHYQSKPCGVYRILSTGIWNRFGEFEKSVIQAQCYLDYNAFYEYKYNTFFISRAYQSLLRAADSLKNLPNQELNFSKDIQNAFFNILHTCSRHPSLLQNEQRRKLKKLKIKYKILYFLCRYCREKLQKKDIIV